MTVEVDVRTREDHAGAAPRTELHEIATEVSAALPGDHNVRIVSFDTASGNAAVVVSSDAPPAEEGRYVRRALDHVHRLAPALGFAPQQAAEFVADPDYQTTSTGAVAVHLRQQYKGLPVYDAAETVRFGTEGQLLEVAGRSFTVAEDIEINPAIGAEGAVHAAVAHLAATGSTPGGGDGDGSRTDDGDGDGDGGGVVGGGGGGSRGDGEEASQDPFGEPLYEPAPDPATAAMRVVTASADRPDRPTVIEATSFERPVTVSLAWFPVGGTLRLSWHLRLQPVGGPEYRFLVDAYDARILLCRRLTRTLGLTGRAQVVLRSGEPRQEVTFPRPLSDYGPPVPTDLPPEFPDPWLVNATTSGTSVRAVNAATGRTVSGTRNADQVDFSTPADDGATDQLVVDLFAACSSMHDALYLVGFREADGNFQRDSLGRGGRAGDAVLAWVHPRAVWGTANMSTPVDGSPPVMNMGLVTSTGRHTASDVDVVYHEYTHGLTNRLVGGPLNDTALDAEQSGGMGEGWSDFVACILLDKTVIGDWVVNRPRGIRRQAYTDAFTGTYADLGSTAYSRVHDVGELWCAVLMSLSRRLGRWETLQIVVDALKLTPANPSFLAARDAVLLAARQFAAAHVDGDAEHAAFISSAWTVFARYGMGPGARTNGATLAGIVADFTAPVPTQTPTPTPTPTSVVQASATPALAIPDSDRHGVASTVHIPDAGPVRGVRVTVDISHTFRGDLVVTLISPGGTSAVLHERTGGSTDDLHKTYDSTAGDTAGGALRRLHGHPSGGTWTLQVIDRARIDVGRLEAWSLELDVDARCRS